MSRKHFRLLANAIANIKCLDERERMAELVGAVCSECNERFDWSRWNNMCDVS